MGIAPCRTSFCTATPTKHETVKATLAVVHAKTVGATLAVAHINNDITIKAKLI